MKKRQKKTTPTQTTKLSPKAVTSSAPFIEHLHELRRRLFYIAISVVAWGGLAYAIQQHLVEILLRPAHGQSFIYTSPGGGIDFLFRVCMYSGLVLSTPVIVYSLLKFLAPVMKHSSRQFIVWISLACGLLALAGVGFGYFIGLPAALHFLLHQFTTAQIKPLVTIQSYLAFVTAYLLGSAVLFQLPLILITINRIKPLKPSRLFHYERWVILAAFVLAGLMNPTPNIISQLLIAGPFILVYQLGIVIIAIINRPRRLDQLAAQDSLLQASRQQTVLQPIQSLGQPITRPVSQVVTGNAAPPRLSSGGRPISELRNPKAKLRPTAQAPAAYLPRPVMRVTRASGQRFMDFMPPARVQP